MGALLAAAFALSMAACGNSNAGTIVTGSYYHPSEDTATGAQETEMSAGEPESAAGETLGTDQFLITGNDMHSQCLILEQLATGKQYMYNYSLATRFLDKYGNHTMVSYFEPGRVVCIGEKDTQGRLLEAQISAQVWEYPGVTRYAVDEANGVFRIADTNYTYDEGLFVHSDGNRQRLSDLTELDTLRVVGFGRKILSVSVTTGHGELKLKNTDLFNGSYIQVGRDIFTEITGEMTIEVPEGTYIVAVANNGYGDSTEINIERGEETVLDLDTLKGEGPKFGSVLFAVDVVGAILRIDGKLVDYSQAVSLQYGVHTLSVTAAGYEVLTKRLFVNSPEGTVIIGLTGEDPLATGSGSESENASESTGDGAVAGSMAGSLAGSHGANATTNNSGSVTNGVTGQAELDAIIADLLGDDDSADYLSTIWNVISDLVDDD